MKFLVIGLGSMGKRRIRCLKHLGYGDIVGVDPREDRRLETSRLHAIRTEAEVRDVSVADYDVVIVSTPPHLHSPFARLALDQKKPVFIEASVMLEEVVQLKENNPSGVLVAPSCTLVFHQAVRSISDIVTGADLGRVVNYSYHSGQYLPDWHPWEDINDYYVSNRSTGGAREIVPFELTWLAGTFGRPVDAKGFFRKGLDLGVDIEDMYSFSIIHEGGALGNITVDVVSRYGTRSLLINLERGQIRWNWEDDHFSVFDSKKNHWLKVPLDSRKAEQGYNQNIGEQMYIDEIRSFVEAASGRSRFWNTLDQDIMILKVLERIEESDGGFHR